MNGFCEGSNEIQGCIKAQKSLGQVNNNEVFKEESIPWSSYETTPWSSYTSYIIFNRSKKLHTSHNYIQLLKTLRQYITVLFAFRSTCFLILLFSSGTCLPYAQLFAEILCSYWTFRPIKYYHILASWVQCIERQKDQSSDMN